MGKARGPSEQPSPVARRALPGPRSGAWPEVLLSTPAQDELSRAPSFLPEPRRRERQCVPSSTVQWTQLPMGRRETWVIIQGLPLTAELRRVPFPSEASVPQSEK